MRRLMLGAISMCVVVGAATAGPLEDAAAAHARGDFATALRLIRPLADQGVAGTQALLGLMFTPCKDVPQDYSEALTWYRRAAAQGDARAQVNLGNLYYFGKGVPLDRAEAAIWYRKAADQGEADARIALGFMYREGQGVPQDDALAHMWLDFAIPLLTEPGLRDSVVAMRDSVTAKMTAAHER